MKWKFKKKLDNFINKKCYCLKINFESIDVNIKKNWFVIIEKLIYSNLEIKNN
jgi:hypothetical protein